MKQRETVLEQAIEALTKERAKVHKCFHFLQTEIEIKQKTSEIKALIITVEEMTSRVKLTEQQIGIRILLLIS